MFWYTRFQTVFLAVLVTFQSGNGNRIRRMSYEVLHDELDFAESVIRQQRNGDWSSRLSQGADSNPSSTASATSSAPSQTSSTTSTSVITQAPHTHITSIIKAIRVLEDIKDDKPTSTPKKKRYFKGAYKSLSTSKKVHILPTALPLKQEKVTANISPTTPETKHLSTAASVKKSTKSSRNAKLDQFVMQLPTVTPTTPLPKTLTSSPSKNSDVLLRRATLKEHTPTRSTPRLTKATQKIPTAYLIPVDMKITSPADVISKSVTKSIQKIPKWQTSAKSSKKSSTSKSAKRPIAKKVVVVKKVIKPTRKTTTASPTAGYKYPELYNYRQQDDESEEDYSNEYRKRLQKEFGIPRYEDSEEDHYRFTQPIKRMKVSSYPSNEEPEEPRIDYPSFEMPKIDLSASNLNQKGCKTVVKEVQEHPINDKNASATILHPVFYHYSPYSRKRRSVKSIIVTKECVFPGDDEEVTKAPYQPQADNLREIYHHPYSSRRPDILKPQSSKISTDKKEYAEEPNSERYSKSFSRSYHSTSKPYRKEHSYYSTSKPVVKKYSHSESSGNSDRGNRNYNPYEPKHFGQETYGFRPSYQHDYQGPHGEESRGVDHHRSFKIPDYGKLARENYDRMPDYSRPSNQDHVYRPAYENHHERNRNVDQRKKSEDNRGGDSENDKPKKARKSFAYYRKDNDPKNNGFSEQYAQGSYASYSTDYDSDRDGPERNAKRS